MPSTPRSVEPARRATRSHGNMNETVMSIGSEMSQKNAAPSVSRSDTDTNKPTLGTRTRPSTSNIGRTVTTRQGNSTRHSESGVKTSDRSGCKRSADTPREGRVKQARVEPDPTTVHVSSSPRRSSRAVVPNTRFKDMEMIAFGKRKSGKVSVKVVLKEKAAHNADTCVEQQAEPETVIEEVITEDNVLTSAVQMNLMDEMLVLPQSTITSATSTIIGVQSINLTEEGIAREMKPSAAGQQDLATEVIDVGPEPLSIHPVREHSRENKVVHVLAKQPSSSKSVPFVPSIIPPQQNAMMANVSLDTGSIQLGSNQEVTDTDMLSHTLKSAITTTIDSSEPASGSHMTSSREHVTMVTDSGVGGTKATPVGKISTPDISCQEGSIADMPFLVPETLKHNVQNSKLSPLDTVQMSSHSNVEMLELHTGEVIGPNTFVGSSNSNKSNVYETVTDTIVVDNALSITDTDQVGISDHEPTGSYVIDITGQTVTVPLDKQNVATTPHGAVEHDVEIVAVSSASKVVESLSVFGNLPLANENPKLLSKNAVRVKDVITKGQVIHVSPSKLQTVSQSLYQSRAAVASHSTQKKQPTLPKSLIIKRPEANSNHVIPQIIKVPVVRKERQRSLSGDMSKTVEYRYEKFTPPPVDTYATHVRIAPSTTVQGESTVQTFSVETNAHDAAGSPVNKEQVVTVVESQQFTDISPIVQPIISAHTDLATAADAEMPISVAACPQTTGMTNVVDNMEQVILPGTDVDAKQVENVTELVGCIQQVVPGTSPELAVERHMAENTFCEVIEYGKEAVVQPESLTAIEYVMFGNNLVPIHKPAPAASIWTQNNRQGIKKPGRVEVPSTQPATRQATVKPIATKEAETLINQLMENAKAGTLDIHNAFEVVSLVTKEGSQGLNDQGQDKAHQDQQNPTTFTAHGHIERPDPRPVPANVMEITEGAFVKEVYRDDAGVTQASTGMTVVDPKSNSSISPAVSNQILVTVEPTSLVVSAQSNFESECSSVTTTASAPHASETSTQSGEITETIEIVTNWPSTQTGSIVTETGSVTHNNETGSTNVTTRDIVNGLETGKQSVYRVKTLADANIVVINVEDEGSSQDVEPSDQTVLPKQLESSNQKKQQTTSQCDNTIVVHIRKAAGGNNAHNVNKPVQKTMFPQQGTILKSDNIITIKPHQTSPAAAAVSHERSSNMSSSQHSTAGTQTPVTTELSMETGTGTQTMEHGIDDDMDSEGYEDAGDSDNEVHMDIEPGAKTVGQKAMMPTINKVSSQEYVMVHLPEGTEIKPPTIKRPVKVDLGITDDQIPMTDDGKYWCVDCPYVTDRKPNWFKHKRKHLGIKPHDCHRCAYKASTSSNLKRHMLIHDDVRDFHCIVCGLMFRQKIHLDRHIKYRHKEKKVKCPLCDYQCSSENPDLKIHMRRRHMPGEDGTMASFTCDECGLLTVSRKDLRQHKKFHRKGPELKLFCEYCSFVTDCESRLRRHMLVHTKEKPFQCGLCQYRATQKEHVLRHMRSQHDIEVVRQPRKVSDEEKDVDEDAMSGDSESEKDRPFDKADYSSNDKIFACNHCPMKFAKLINLYKHLYTQHKNVMPDPAAQDFQCVVCDFRTNNKKNLLVHMRKHNMTDQTPPSHVYSCVLCRYMNPRRRNLFQHMKKKHGIDIVVKADGSTNCYLSDNTPVVLSSDNGDGTIVPITDIAATQSLDEDGTFIQPDNDGQLRIVTDDRPNQPATISIDSIISVEDMSIYSSNNNADMPSISETQIATTATPLYQSSYVEHEAAEAIEGLQALAQQAGILEVQTVDNDVTSEVVTSEILNQEDIVAAEEVTGSLADEEIQLSSEQINQLSSGDYVEIDGEVYKVEISTPEQARL